MTVTVGRREREGGANERASGKKRGEKNDLPNYRSGRGEIRVSPRCGEVNVMGSLSEFPGRPSRYHTHSFSFSPEDFVEIPLNSSKSSDCKQCQDMSGLPTLTPPTVTALVNRACLFKEIWLQRRIRNCRVTHRGDVTVPNMKLDVPPSWRLLWLKTPWPNRY